jgi:ornithine decarboxylase
LPGVKPFYAVKCNPEHLLLQWLDQAGAGFDCASAREVDVVQASCHAQSGGPEILFANPCKKERDVLHAAKKNIKTTVVDSHEEIDKLQSLGWSGTSLIRILVDDSGSTMPFSAKFGLSPKEVECLGNYARIKGQELRGISFHVGSGCGNPLQYKVAIEQAATALGILKQTGHSRATIIDIGGGFVPETFDKTAEVIRKTIENLPANIKLLGEPGRFMAAQSHDLFVRVIGKKPNKAGKGWRYTLDESLYGQFSCIPFDHAQPKWIRVREKGEERRAPTKAVLYGRTCDSVDFIAAAEEAEELMVGDMLWFPNMGAYTTVTSTEFNGFPKPPVVCIQSHDNQQLPSATEREFAALWPKGCQYASVVKVPELR